MATLTFSVDSIAQGNNVSGGLEVNALPIEDFLINQGYSDTSNAVFTIEINDSDLMYSDVTDDGVPDYWIASYTQPEAMYIDADGDGTPEYQVIDQNNNSPIVRDNQSGDYMAKINQNLFVYDYPYDPSNPGTSLGTTGGNLYFATDGDNFSLGEVRAPDDSTIDPDDQLLLGAGVAPTPAICYLSGTTIATPSGPRQVETLKVGDLVTTHDHGPMPIRWVSSREESLRQTSLNHRLRAVCIPAGALAPGYPEHDLRVSRQHRLAVSSPIVHRMFDSDAVLVPAVMLIGHCGIEVDPPQAIEYVHIALDHHALIWANGALSETLLPGPMALRNLDHKRTADLIGALPEIAAHDYRPTPARPILKRKQAKQLLKRHLKNRKPLFHPMTEPASQIAAE